MGKQRGFKPQGIANPIMLARLNRPVQAGPTIRERLDRADRPTWQDVKAAAQKKEKCSSEYLEQWENVNFQKELEVKHAGKFEDLAVLLTHLLHKHVTFVSVFREMKRGEQEKANLIELTRRKGGAAAAAKLSDSDSSSNNGSDDNSARQTSLPNQRHDELDKHEESRRKKKRSSRRKEMPKDEEKQKHHYERNNNDSDSKHRNHKKRKHISKNRDSKRRRTDDQGRIEKQQLNPYKMSDFMKLAENV